MQGATAFSLKNYVVVEKRELRECGPG